ncbi:hypothetical protein HYT58_01490 [Candidatus Woesearchaeota archaeon]|nr:hypothetical protein [Candidatus Woesearchaeota archaeon]
MSYIFEVRDKTKRKIYLTEKGWKHIIKHSEMQNKLEDIKNTLINPIKITMPFQNKAQYYRHIKSIESKAKYLRVIVKYLNGEGFVITGYFVEHIT